MEKIQNLIKIIQNNRQQNTGTNEIINQVFNETKNFIEEIFPKVFTKREILLEDLNYILKKKEKMILNGEFIDDFSRHLYHFECLLIAILHDYKLKIFIEEKKNPYKVEPILLKCYEAIGKLFNFYLYFWSCEKHYVHRSEIEKILILLKNHKNLLIEKFDVNLIVERISKYNIEKKPDEYVINLDELQIRIYMSGDCVGFIFMDLFDHSPIFSFLDSIKQKLLENERRKIYQKIEKKYPECFFHLKKQLDDLDFSTIYPVLSPNGELWLKIIGKLFGLLRVSAKDRGILREQAQSWESEEKDMSPWTNRWLDERFGKRHTIKAQISDGHSDHFIDDIALEDKLLRTNENLNNDNLIEEKYKKEKRQIKREGIIGGFQILIIVDIREEIKNSRLDVKKIAECFKIFYEEGYWTAAFLFQAFNDTPSNLK